MRAGILTFYDSDNYGAVLQAYALQRALKKLSCESELVSFERSSAGNAQKRKELNSPLIKRVEQRAVERHSHFQHFRDEQLVVSNNYTADGLRLSGDVYDFFISGSDQVWNPEIPGFSVNYFLPFAAPQKRYSYAASFGRDAFPEGYAARAGQLLSDFRRISVREESALNIVRSLSGADARVDIDPVLLLGANEWEELIPNGKKDFVFLYMLANDPEMEKQAAAYADLHGKELIAVTAFPISSFGFDAYSGCSVYDWLYYISHAEAVFTNSFHGAAFALLFGSTLFLSMLRGNLADRSIRLYELLKLIKTDYDGADTPINIGRERFDSLIAPKRISSMEYLEEIVKEQQTC